MTFSIEDDGRGIPEADRERLFEPFERGQTLANGTGVGLYIVRQWVGLMGGTVGIRSSQFGGARFDICIPLRFEDSPADQGSRTLPQLEVVQKSLASKRVLLAEDDPVLRKVVKRQLEQLLQLEVTAVENGQAALNLLEDNPYDLLITDYFMPGLDGRKLILTLRERGITLPIMGITAATIGEERNELTSAGADAVLTKPIKKEALITELTRLMDEGRIAPSMPSASKSNIVQLSNKSRPRD